MRVPPDSPGPFIPRDEGPHKPGGPEGPRRKPPELPPLDPKDTPPTPGPDVPDPAAPPPLPAPRDTGPTPDSLPFTLQGMAAAAVSVQEIARLIVDANLAARDTARLDRQQARDAEMQANLDAADKIRDMANFNLGAAIASSSLAIAGAAMTIKGAMKAQSARAEASVKTTPMLEEAKSLREGAKSLGTDAKLLAGTDKTAAAKAETGATRVQTAPQPELDAPDAGRPRAPGITGRTAAADNAAARAEAAAARPRAPGVTARPAAADTALARAEASASQPPPGSLPRSTPMARDTSPVIDDIEVPVGMDAAGRQVAPPPAAIVAKDGIVQEAVMIDIDGPNPGAAVPLKPSVPMKPDTPAVIADIEMPPEGMTAAPKMMPTMKPDVQGTIAEVDPSTQAPPVALKPMAPMKPDTPTVIADIELPAAELTAAPKVVVLPPGARAAGAADAVPEGTPQGIGQDASRINLRGEARTMRGDARRLEQEAHRISTTAEANALQIDKNWTNAGIVTTEVGKMTAAGLQRGAAEKDAEKAELQAKAALHRTRAEDEGDFIRAYTDNIRNVTDKLSAIQQSEAETMRSIIHG
jgi:hypothetical protein